MLGNWPYFNLHYSLIRQCLIHGYTCFFLPHLVLLQKGLLNEWKNKKLGSGERVRVMGKEEKAENPGWVCYEQCQVSHLDSMWAVRPHLEEMILTITFKNFYWFLFATSLVVFNVKWDQQGEWGFLDSFTELSWSPGKGGHRKRLAREGCTRGSNNQYDVGKDAMW